MTKGMGFPITRKRSEQRQLWPLSAWPWLLALAALLWIAGATRLWPQSNGLSLSDSGSISTEWERLFNQGLQIYNRQSTTLERLTSRILTLETGYGELTDLSGQLLQSNENLRTFNEQISKRMQGRDEELVLAYDEIDRLKDRNARLTVTVIIAIVAAVVLAAGVLTLLFILMRR